MCRPHIPCALLLVALLAACNHNRAPHDRTTGAVADASEPGDTVRMGSPMVRAVVQHAIGQTSYTVSYDPSYTVIDYPGGDVPRERGVCSDVVVRALRARGIDLQRKVHEDMLRNFSAYPALWGLAAPDANIDHRRVPNLMRYFERIGISLPVTNTPADYLPGDIVAWELGNKRLHVGITTNRRAGKQLLMVHNIGSGARVEDVLFAWKIIGHYRYRD